MSDSSPSSSALTPPCILLSVLATFTAAGGYLADWDGTNVYNPKWLRHPDFHNGQTMSTGLGLGLLTASYTWRPTDILAMSGGMDDLFMTKLCRSLYWITQVNAILCTGTDLVR